MIRKTFEHRIPEWLTLWPQVKEDWDACLLTLEGHSCSVNSVVFSHDSTMVASASSDNTVRIWDAKTGQRKLVLAGHSLSVSSVVFSHDSTMVASASSDKMVRIWDAKTGKCKHVLEGHTEYVGSVVFSHGSMSVASASYDNTVRIWDAKTGKCKHVLEGHSKSVNSVVFSHDSMMVASASDDNTVRIWDAKTGECKYILEGHTEEVNSVVFSHDSMMVASASWDETVRIWDAKTGKCKEVIPSSFSTDILSFTPDDGGVVTNNGVLAFTGDRASSAQPPMPSQPLAAAALGLRDETWVTTAGKDLLWLPTECRRAKSAILANTIVIGCESGRLIVLGFSAAKIEKL